MLLIVLQGGGVWDLRDTVFSAVCTLDASHNSGSPGRGHPRVNLHPAHVQAGHVHAAVSSA